MANWRKKLLAVEKPTQRAQVNSLRLPSSLLTVGDDFLRE
jgi:hypothetical protein